jgi:NADH dehydrogenase FAD-containing subunit
MAHPNKKVTIVHGARLPVSDHFPDYFREKAVKSLEEHGVDIVLNEKVDIDTARQGRVVKLSSGKSIPADLVVCFSQQNFSNVFLGCCCRCEATRGTRQNTFSSFVQFDHTLHQSQ